MRTLKERQADRARRKVENAKLAEENGIAGNTGNDRVGNVLSLMAPAQAAIENLSADEQAELQARLKSGGEPTKGYADAPVFPMAGIGVVNPFVVPVVGAEAAAIPGGDQSGNGGNADPASVSPGDALANAQAAAAWGTGAAADASPAAPAADAANEAVDETVDADGKPLTATKLKAILDSRNVKYETDANVPALQALVKANPAPAAS